MELIGKWYKKKELHSEAEEEATGEMSQPAQALFKFEMKLSEWIISVKNLDYSRDVFD